MPRGFDPYHVWLGIPPEEQPPHHYRLLSVPLFEDNPDVIEAKYPYNEDGSRMWNHSTPWPDVWVATAAMAVAIRDVVSSAAPPSANTRNATIHDRIANSSQLCPA